MWISKKRLDTEIRKRVDALVDPLTARGSATDKTQRLIGSHARNTNHKNLGLYVSNGFVQNIVDQPAEDATREWIKITTNEDVNEALNIPKLIEDRLTELNVREKIKDLIRYSRMYSRGSFLYYGVLSQNAQGPETLKAPIPSEIKSIDFINVIDNPEKVMLSVLNKNDPTKKDYNQIKFTMGGYEIHPSRLSWMVNSFIPSDQQGISVIQTIQDAITAQDSGLWSVSSILSAMALKIFKSDYIADLDITKKAELLAVMRHLIDTQSVLALTKDEDFEQLDFNIKGAKEIFEFIFDNLSGLSRTPKMILLGKAHGVVTAGEFDTLNYYAQIAKFQENQCRPIIQKNIDMIVSEKNGEIYRAVAGKIDDLNVSFEFNSLWKLDPLSQADQDLKNSQRDQIDITVGKMNPAEARQLDPRLSELEPFVMDRKMPPDMTPPDQKKPEDKLEVPEDKKTDDTE